MSNRGLKLGEIPEKITVGLEDLVLFDDLGFYVNLTTHEERDTNEFELEKVDNFRKYRCMSHDLYSIINDENFSGVQHPKEERRYMRKYNRLVYVYLQY